MDGVFLDDFQSWCDQYSLRLPAEVVKSGRCLAFKLEMLKVPVLCRFSQHKVTNDPVQTVDIHPQIRRLGKLCGFEERFIVYCLRRRIAYLVCIVGRGGLHAVMMDLLLRTHSFAVTYCEGLDESHCFLSIVGPECYKTAIWKLLTIALFYHDFLFA